MSPRNEREANSLMGPSTDSQLERWLEAADRKKAKVDYELRALALICVFVLIGVVIAGSIALARACS